VRRGFNDHLRKFTPSIAGYREKKRIFPVGARATCGRCQRLNQKNVEKSYLADGENVVYIQALEKWPHRKVDVNQATPKI
jgi:hypothetical protein